MAKRNEMFIELGEYLRDRRVAAKLSQNDVARALKYSNAQFISNFERGLCSPPLAALRTLISLYKIPAKEMVGFLVQQQKRFLEQELTARRSSLRRKTG